ncbi:glycosyltransferase family 2 protein [Sanyastnella coralliicola]|uniref:glycosyltransferase family 2 protein n=1 Tax=Sanyastnella coralliicola TaxID=3069118 RepID=UPI0027B959AA|nr:glycosyltransferase family 2 protein [Longitalea sp. SCSIO 12813]
MKVSIITIAWNSAETIEDTIKSVIAQDYPDIEYIVVDGASKDDTMKIVERHRDGIAKVVSEPDKGIYDAMNKGVKLATGDVIGILNSDDFYADEKVISEVVARFKETGSDGLYADLTYVNRDQTDKVIRYWKAGEYKPGLFRKGWMPPHPTFFVKKTCYDQFGIYSLELRSAADYELMLRFIHKNEISVTYLPRVITRMREGGESNVTLKNRIRANKEDRRAWKMNGLTPGAFTLIRKPLSKLSQFIKKGA